jgi:LAS superfamily LD-carboxypeptidase LdcB
MNTYPNGKLPSSALYLVQGISKTKGARYANQPTAHDYKAFKKAAAKVGIALSIPAYGDYRNLAVQAGLKNDPTAYGSHMKSAAIASAGSSSHGLGYNLDVYANINAYGKRKGLTQDRAWAWVLKHMSEYKFSQRDAKRDPHCFAHKAV